MTTTSFPSNSELAFCVWLLNYKDKILEYGPKCSLGAAEISATLADIDFYIFLLQEFHQNIPEKTRQCDDYKQFMVTGYCHGDWVHPTSRVFPNMPPVPAPGIQNRLVDQITRIKANSHYTETMGHELGIISTAEISAIYTVKQFVDVGNRVRKDILSYDYEGAWIDSHLNGADWAFFGE